MFPWLGVSSYSPQVPKTKITKASRHVLQNKGIKLSKAFQGYIQKVCTCKHLMITDLVTWQKSEVQTKH